MKIRVGNKEFSLDDIEDELFAKKILPKCAPNCMATNFGAFDVIYSAYNNIKYIVENNIPGDIVECGVWKGGIMQLAALTLAALGDTSRSIYLYDTFEGMPEPGKFDVDWNGNSPHKKWESMQWENITSVGSRFGFGGTLETVSSVMNETSYPVDNFVYVKGMVETTIPNISPSKIAYLRLDTDWYSSTAHELEHLYPLLSLGGVLVIDDYGYYKGSRKATDEYFKKNKVKMLLSRVSHLGVREGVKQK